MADGSSRRVPTIPDIDLGPRRATLRDEVAHRLEAEGAWNELAAHLLDQMQKDTEHARDIAAQLAEVLEERLDKPDKAAKVFVWVLDRMPGDALAIRELERLYGEMEDWTGLCQAYRLGLEATTDVFAQTALLEKILLIQREALDDTPGMRATCLEAMTLIPRCAWAWQALEASHATDESWWELIQALTEVAMQAGDRAGMITLRLAAVMDEHLGKPDKAIALYEAAIREGANARDALDGLEVLYAETEDWGQLVHTYKRLFPLISDRTELADLRRNCAMVLADGLGDAEGAIALYDALLEEDPDDKASFQAMLALQKRQ